MSQDTQSVPLAYSIPAFAVAANVSVREIWRAIADGKLAARKRGRHTIILYDDGKSYLRSLPKLPTRTRP